MPAPSSITQASRLKLVDDHFPTDKRRRVAEYIEEHWNEEGGLQITGIAEELDVSRELVRNTLRDHFEEESEADLYNEETFFRMFDVAMAAYRTGYQDGLHDRERQD